jgi:RecA/RadA recombinase
MLIDQHVQSGFFKQLRLVMIDSVGALFSPLMGSSGTSNSDKYSASALLSSFSRTVHSLATTFNLAFVVTNHCSMYEGIARPALGSAWLAMANVRLIFTPTTTQTQQQSNGQSTEEQKQTERTTQSLLHVSKSTKGLSAELGVLTITADAITVTPASTATFHTPHN